METRTIAEVYETNKNIHDQLVATVGSLSNEEVTALPDGEKWSIQQFVEHIAIVDDGMAKICAKLLGEAKTLGVAGDGRAVLSEEFGTKSGVIAVMKVEAPERVRPTGNVSINEALEQMKASAEVFATLKPDFETYDNSEHKFPHPFFGPITATEWLVLAGGHKMRHIKQIEKLIERVRT